MLCWVCTLPTAFMSQHTVGTQKMRLYKQAIHQWLVTVTPMETIALSASLGLHFPTATED